VSNVFPNPDETPFVDVIEAGRLLGVGKETAYRAVRTGEIPSIRVGKKIRVPVAELRRLAHLDN